VRKLDFIEAELIKLKRLRHAEIVTKSYNENKTASTTDTAKEPGGGRFEI